MLCLSGDIHAVEIHTSDIGQLTKGQSPTTKTSEMIWSFMDRERPPNKCHLSMIGRKRVVVMVHWASLPLSNIYQFVEALYYARLAIPRQVHPAQVANASVPIYEVPPMDIYLPTCSCR